MRTIFALIVGGMFSIATAGAEELAWQSTRYVPPDFEGFFPDDPDGGRVLDEQLSGGWTAGDTQELLEIIRRGLRRSTVQRARILESVGQRYIWRRPSETEPQHPYAIELMYHASGSPEFRDDAHYYGLQVVRDKPDNVLRAVMDYGYENVERSVWGIQTYDDSNQVAARLLAMLEYHDELPPQTVLATYASYRRLTGHAPPRSERFKDLGSFVIVFEQESVGIDDLRSADELRTAFAQTFGLSDGVIDFTRRAYRGRVQQVALVRGIPTHDRILEELPKRDGHALVFSHRHTATDKVRLPEFHQRIAGGDARAGPVWADQVADAKAVYTWNRTDAYVPPDYEGFFPDDVEGGRKLDELIAAGDELTATDREVLETARRGWRRSQNTPQALLGWLGHRFILWPEHPSAVEIFYHTLGAPASEPHRASGAVYHGFVNLKDKPENVLRALEELYLKADTSNGIRSDILRSVVTASEKQRLAELFLTSIENYRSTSPMETVAAYEGYRALTGQAPPNAARLGGIGRFVVVFRRDEVKTPEDLVKRFAEEHAKDATVLETMARVERNKVSGFALVDGIAERDRLLEALSRDDRYSIDAALPLTTRVVEDKEGIPEFRQYLESAQPNPAER